MAATSRLYTAALQLPIVTDEDVNVLSRLGTDDWSRIADRVSRQLARDLYWEVFEPLEQQQPEPVAGSLTDDLADIWRDVKEGLLAIDEGNQSAVPDAVWNWRFNLESHWGHHAVCAIQALHALCFGQFADPNKPSKA